MENRIAIVLKNAWVGKEFIYVSKYGSETRGIVKDVVVVNEIIANKTLAGYLKKKVEEQSKNKPNTTIMNYMGLNDEIESNYIGTRPTFKIISENNNTYSLDEIYFIS
jgi:hypothetical protein